jgi:peptide/nickel transport system permease protein
MRPALNPNWIVVVLVIGVLLILLAGSFFPLTDPTRIAPRSRLMPPDWQYWLGTDQLGRDVFWRTVAASRISVGVGVCVALLSIFFGTAIALVCATNRAIDHVVMRIMDAAMAVPAILLAIVLVAMFRGGVVVVIIAISVPEIPRIVRLVRSIALSTMAEVYVEASRVLGTGM